MDPTTVLNTARDSLSDVAERVVALVGGLAHTTAPILPGHWTVREATVHVINETNQGAEEATGAPSPHLWTNKESHNAQSDARIADIPESDPQKLASLLADAAGRLLDATAGGSGQTRVTGYGLDCNLAELTCVYFGEWVMHGYDIAAATGRPWPIDSLHAQLTLAGWAPFFPSMLHPEASQGHTAAYGIDLRGGAGMILRFTDGALALDAAGSAPVDCVISADPVAFLLVGLGRMTLWQAIALGLLTAGGDRPDLAYGFFDLFDAP
jgi:Mycothiol maleylpyruvate isomerase N-terminal domain/SCP-2 sterol transfer family